LAILTGVLAYKWCFLIWILRQVKSNCRWYLLNWGLVFWLPSDEHIFARHNLIPRFENRLELY
jgi:hypothetical protein